MGFWDNKIREIAPPPPPPQQHVEQTVAPGAWWQQRTPQQQPQQTPAGYVPRQQQAQYHPPQAQRGDDETCPRCGSEDYTDFTVETEAGCQPPPPGMAKRKQCFDCRYPLFNASGDMLSSAGAKALAGSGKIKTIRTIDSKRSGFIPQGRPLAMTMDSAVNIDGYVS